jgi:hypothetical protein
MRLMKQRHDPLKDLRKTNSDVIGLMARGQVSLPCGLPALRLMLYRNGPKCFLPRL